MKTYPNDCAFPTVIEDGIPSTIIGLTKREYYAGLAMQGLLANEFVFKDIAIQAAKLKDSAYLGKVATEFADNLIITLNESEANNA